jgi:hypothetical protein
MPVVLFVAMAHQGRRFVATFSAFVLFAAGRHEKGTATRAVSIRGGTRPLPMPVRVDVLHVA